MRLLLTLSLEVSAVICDLWFAADAAAAAISSVWLCSLCSDDGEC